MGSAAAAADAAFLAAAATLEEDVSLRPGPPPPPLSVLRLGELEEVVPEVREEVEVVVEADDAVSSEKYIYILINLTRGVWGLLSLP